MKLVFILIYKFFKEKKWVRVEYWDYQFEDKEI